MNNSTNPFKNNSTHHPFLTCAVAVVVLGSNSCRVPRVVAGGDCFSEGAEGGGESAI